MSSQNESNTSNIETNNQNVSQNNTIPRSPSQKPVKKLTLKQLKFVSEYIKSGNATQSAIKAGYSKKTACSQGQRLLTNVDIQLEISKYREKVIEKTGITAEWVLNNFREISERCMQKVPVMKFNRTTKKMELVTKDGEGVWQFDSVGANRANENLGKHLGIFEKDNLQKSDIKIEIIRKYDGENEPI